MRKETLEQPANFSDEMEICPMCNRRTLDYNQYHHWVSCPVCGYMKKGVYKWRN